jgi:hypothetical protein
MSWALAKNLTERSLPEIGRYMGGRDHTSIIHGIRSIGARIQNDPRIASRYAKLAESIIVLGEEVDKADRTPVQFEGIDPLELAEAVLGSKFSDIAPTMGAMRSLCRGILHYADEVDSLTALLTAQAAELEQARQALANEASHKAKERSLFEDRISNLCLGNAKTDAIVSAATVVCEKVKALKTAETTINERPARKALEASLKTLQTTFERI